MVEFRPVGRPDGCYSKGPAVDRFLAFKAKQGDNTWRVSIFRVSSNMLVLAWKSRIRVPYFEKPSYVAVNPGSYPEKECRSSR